MSFIKFINALLFTVLILMVAAAGCAIAGPSMRSSMRPSMVCAPDNDIAAKMKEVAGLSVGKKIVLWAEHFIGTPYDTDPLGAYVRQKKVVCDKEIDCMYLVFRAVELALSDKPEDAAKQALRLRFKTEGRLSEGEVTNYEERFDYAEDMVISGKWGEDVTKSLGAVKEVAGSRGHGPYTYIPKNELLKPENYPKLVDGDIIFFVKDPAGRVVEEVVGHEGIIKAGACGGHPMLIHASGSKAVNGKPGGGVVKEVNLVDYVSKMKFIGAMVTRFN